MPRNYLILLFSALLFGLAALANPEEEVAEGLFTEAQVERGEEAYTQHCASCHGAELEGMVHFPPLAGERFWNRWGGRTAWELFDYTRANMPLGAGGSLEDETYADILAFQLVHYGYLEGERELVPEAEELEAIVLEPVED